MTQSPLPGEQSALRGYRWQYDHVARLVYDAIVDGEFDKLVLASTGAGQVDDLLLSLKGRREAYQFKGQLSRATMTFNDLVRAGRTAAKQPTDSLWRALARGWQQLEAKDQRPLTVHLSMAATYSTSDHVTDVPGNPSPGHFRAFTARALEPLIQGSKTVEDLPEWRIPLQRLQEGSGLDQDDFLRFIPAVRLELGLSEALDRADGTRGEDLRALSNALLREVGNASGPVELDRDQVLALVNWGNRTSFRSVHEFPIDKATYSPLTGAIELLRDKLGDTTAGYIAITGAPGAGKSTLLAQTLAELPDRVVRYYAFIPGRAGNARNRLSAEWFLHDLSTMLRDAGLRPGPKKLPARTVHELRQSVQEQLDAAAEDYAANGRRTVVVVDGLDHVQRDYSGNDALTAELPAPSDIPVGVIFLVGSRDLSPLRGETQQFIEDAGTEINLEHQRLDKSAVIEVCERLDATKGLTRSVHEIIAARSAGHPLSLVYLLSRMGDYTGDDPGGFVAMVPQYDGDIAMLYRAAWDSLDADGELERVLRICSRLRIGFDLRWMSTWATDSTTRRFRTQLRYLFRQERGRWRFFHDSFRQFARERTSIGDDRTPDPAVDKEAHLEVADICESSADSVYAAQALFHRYQADDFNAVLRLGTQDRFRRQFRELRAAPEIADDTKLVLSAAAQRADFTGLLRGLLMLSEISDKSSEIEDVDVCRVLLHAGLVESAIDYVGDEQTLRVPLAQAYNLAADLARQSNSAGERVFRLFQHFGLEQPGGAYGVRTESDIAESWARCAAYFLPLDAALARMTAELPTQVGDREWEFYRAYNLFDETVSAYLKELNVISSDTLQAIDSMLLDETELLSRKKLSKERTSDLTALLADLRVRVHSAFIGTLESFDECVETFKAFRSTLRGIPVRETTLLNLAFLEADYDSAERALETLLRTSFSNTLTLSELGASGDSSAIANHLYYWRLRHELEIKLGRRPASFQAGPISSCPTATATPAGNNIESSAPIHRDTQAIRLVQRIDLLVRHIALTHALVAAGAYVGEDEAWEAISVVTTLFPLTTGRRPDHSLHSLRGKRIELHHLAIDALEAVSPKLINRYEQAMSRKFASQGQDWHSALRVALGVKLTGAAGAAPEWLNDSLAKLEAEAPEQGINGALADLVALVDAYSDVGLPEEAKRVCLTIWRTSFGLGSRNDYQLARWVQWFGRAAPRLKNLDDEAMWFARVLAAAQPLTDQGIGAEYLPESLASASPRTALNTFEYLVAHGAVSHTIAMANLLAALLRVGNLDRESIQLASEFTSAVIAAAGNSFHPGLAEALAKCAAPAVLGNLKAELAKVALPTTRESWAAALGKTPESENPQPRESDEYGGLELRSETRLSTSEVQSRAVDLESLRALVAEESTSSYFDWIPVLAKNFIAVDARVITDVFTGTRHEGKVLVWAAERELGEGRIETSQVLARDALTGAPLGAWSSVRDTVRRDAIRLLVVTEAMTPTDAAQDFVRFVTDEYWYSSMLNTDVDEIFATFGADTSGPEFWEIVREYLDGLSENLQMPSPVTEPPSLKWWIAAALPGQRSASPLTAAEAVAELVSMHLTHPIWPVRDGTVQVIVSALKRGSKEIVNALLRLVDTDVTDDVLEVVAACLAAAGSVRDPALDPLRARITTHQNFVIRRLSAPDSASHELRIARSLPAIYSLQLPENYGPEPETRLGADPPFLAPFEGAYRLLARVSGLDVNTIITVAGHYATKSLENLPESEPAKSALLDAGMKLIHPSSVVLASRAAFGYVLGDLVDSGRVGPLPLHVESVLRTGDVAMVGRGYDRMPNMFPAHPPAGHDQTAEAWAAGAEARIDEYVRSFQTGPDQIIGARGNLAILNWPHVEEHFACDIVRRGESRMRTVVRVNAWTSDLAATSLALGELDEAPFLLRNESNAFMERHANWLALHPGLASLLGWKSDSKSIGGWRTATGCPAAATTIWTNGTWGRYGQMFDDAVSEGCAVVLTQEGLSEVKALLGPLDLILSLSRMDHHGNGLETKVSRRIELG
ncbi:ATP-binding protein [Microbacterium sp. MPKO10]|uniref:ATP-binding protein n=1 Tax=Microbacterium sp. MPKO10 TaxID=2989818 RepID=UPI0022357F97|nr:ATP-binding protein [Microbacterium sp. MPKO10]MCW4459754.1 ATP-binding protein [Microbacterium sp. MPKO10]